MKIDVSLPRRLSAATVAHGLFATQNVVLVFAAARSFPPVEFGRFALLLTLFTLGQGLARGLLGEPLALVPGRAAKRSQELIYLTCVAAAGLGVVMAVLAYGLGFPFVLVGMTTVVAVLADWNRYTYFAKGRPGPVVTSDTLWLVVQLATLLGWHLVVGQIDAIVLFVAWLLGSGTSLAWSTVDLRTFAHSKDAVNARWVTKVGWRFATEYLLMAGPVNLLMLFVAAAGNVEGVGHFKAAQTLVGPLNLLVLTGMSNLTPELARDQSASHQEHRRVWRNYSLAMTVSVSIGLAILMPLPESFLQHLVGAQAEHVKPFIVGLSLERAALGFVLPRLASMRAWDQLVRATRYRLYIGGSVLGAGAVGGIMAGALGVVFASAFVYLVSAMVFRLRNLLVSS